MHLVVGAISALELPTAGRADFKAIGIEPVCAGMACQCLGPDISALRSKNAELEARQRDLIRRLGAEAVARGDAPVAAFYHEMELGLAARSHGGE